MFRLHLLFYHQLALGWQIADQVSGLNLRLSNNKSYKLKKNEVFHLQ